MAPFSDSLEVLRGREFRLLFAGQAVSVFGDRMIAVALAFAALEVGGNPSAVGLVLACRIVPLVGTVLVGGVIADRTSRRVVMVVADLVRVASQGMMAALVITGTADLWMLAVLAGLTGAATGFFNPASTGLLPQIVEPEQLQPANALRATAISTGEILGPLAALGLVLWGPIAATIGVSVSLWLAFGLFIAAILALLAIPDIRRLSADHAPLPTV